MNELNKIIITGVVSLCVGGLITWFGFNLSNQHEKLDYYKQYEQNFISKDKFSRLRVLIDGVESKDTKFSTLSIGVFNFTSKNLKDVEVTFFIEPSDSSKLDVIEAYLLNRDGESLTSQLVDGYPKVNDKIHIYKYRVPSLIKVDNVKRFNVYFKALLNSEGEPIIRVSTNAVETQEYEVGHVPGQTVNNLLGLFIAVFISSLLLALIIKILTLLTRDADKKIRNEYAKKLFGEMDAKKGGLAISRKQLADWLCKSLFSLNNKRWESYTKLRRLMVNKYEETDYKVDVDEK